MEVSKVFQNITINYNSDEEESALGILGIVLDQFIKLFGVDIMTRTNVVISNLQNVDNPTIYNKSRPIKIVLHLKSYDYYCNYIFQSAHELMHYAIEQENLNTDANVSWFEETVCEAMALYILYKAAKEWSNYPISKSNPNYSEHIKTYFFDEYSNFKDSILEKCKTEDDLLNISNHYNSNREERGKERNYLLDYFISNPSSIKSILDYPKYIDKSSRTKVIINFEKWEKQSKDPKAIKFFSKIQPKIN